MKAQKETNGCVVERVSVSPVIYESEETTLPGTESVDEYIPADKSEESDKAGTYSPYLPTLFT